MILEKKYAKNTFTLIYSLIGLIYSEYSIFPKASPTNVLIYDPGPQNQL